MRYVEEIFFSASELYTTRAMRKQSDLYLNILDAKGYLQGKN